MKRPMPTPMARRRSTGMARATASRSPSRTQARTTRPSRTMRPMAPLPAAGRRRGLERDEGVQPHARRQRDRHVRAQPHEDRGQAGGQRRGGDRGIGRHAGRRQDRRVGHQDVGHRQERGQRAARLASDGGAAAGEIEERGHFPRPAMLEELVGGRQHRDEDDAEHHQREVLLHDRHVAEQRSRRRGRRRPRSPRRSRCRRRTCDTSSSRRRRRTARTSARSAPSARAPRPCRRTSRRRRAPARGASCSGACARAPRRRSRRRPWGLCSGRPRS